MICKNIYFIFICVPQTTQYNLACLGIKDYKAIIHFIPKKEPKTPNLFKESKNFLELFRKISDLKNWDAITQINIFQFKFDNSNIRKGREICSNIYQLRHKKDVTYNT